jgi:hypothetical protein
MGAMDDLRRAVGRLPVVGPLARKVGGAVLGSDKLKIRDSAGYWEKRYQAGGTSGAGSYSRLARFKAEVLNDFVKTHDVQRVLEFGSGDGSQLELAEYPEYVGVDVAPSAVELGRKKFADDPTKSFYLPEELPADLKADLVLSLDVIYHLVEDDVFDRYMCDVFDRSSRYVIVYSSDSGELSDPGRHVRHRAFSPWIAQHRVDWRLVEKIPNAYPYDPADTENTSFADFYVYEARRG